MRTKRTTWLVGAIIAAALVVAGASLAVAGGFAPSNEKPDLLHPTTQAAGPGVTARIAAISDPRLLAKGSGVLSQRIIDSYAIAPGTVALAARLKDGTQLLLAPASGGVCRFDKPADDADQAVYTDCASEAEAAAGQLVGASGCAQTGMTVSGLVPDGVDAVTVTARNGNHTTVAVTNNVYGITIPAKTDIESLPQTISWSAEKTQPEVHVPIPKNPDC